MCVEWGEKGRINSLLGAFVVIISSLRAGPPVSSSNCPVAAGALRRRQRRKKYPSPRRIASTNPPIADPAIIGIFECSCSGIGLADPVGKADVDDLDNSELDECVACDEGDFVMKVDVVLGGVIKVAAWSIPRGHPSPSHGSASQHPWNVGVCSEHRHQSPWEHRTLGHGDASWGEEPGGIPAARRYFSGHPVPSQGLLVQHPMKKGSSSAHSNLESKSQHFV